MKNWGRLVLGFCCALSAVVMLVVLETACDDDNSTFANFDAGAFDAHFNAAEFCEVCKKQGVLEEQTRESQADIEKLKAQKAQLEIEIKLLKQLQPEHKP